MTAKPESKQPIKLTSKVNSFTEVQKSLQEIEKQLNDLSQSINKPAESEAKETEGKTGDTRVTANPDKTYNFEVCTKDGWKIPVIGNSVVKFSNKPADITKPAFKSIGAIIAEDTKKGQSIAQKTIYDEKNEKFVLPRPDYEEWFDVQVQRFYVTGATDGTGAGTDIANLDQTVNNVFYNGASAGDATGEIIGIPALGFKLTTMPSLVKIWAAPPGCRSFADAISANQGIWAMPLSQDYWDEATANTYYCGFSIIGENNVMIHTAEGYTFFWHGNSGGAGYTVADSYSTWYDAFLGSGNGTSGTSAYCLQIWK